MPYAIQYLLGLLVGRISQRFHNAILNYFDFQVTHAFTKGVHTKCKLIKRQGFGFIYKLNSSLKL
jgi:transposase